MTPTAAQIALAATVKQIEAEIDAMGADAMFSDEANARLISLQAARKTSEDALLVACGHDLTKSGSEGVKLAFAALQAA